LLADEFVYKWSDVVSDEVDVWFFDVVAEHSALQHHQFRENGYKFNLSHKQGLILYKAVIFRFWLNQELIQAVNSGSHD
jgi:hypothetical protein